MAEPLVPPDGEQEDRRGPRPGSIDEQLHKENIQLHLEKQGDQKRIADLEASVIRLTPSDAKIRLRVIFLACGCVGWAVLMVWFVSLCWASYAVFHARWLASSEPPTAHLPYDPLYDARRSGACGKNASAPCVDIPVVSFSAANRQQLLRFPEEMRRCAEGRGRLPCPVADSRLDLRDLRDSMQRKIIAGEYDFMCAFFMGFPLDYCIAALTKVHATQPEWIDIVGALRITTVNLSATVRSRITVPSSLCRTNHPGTTPSDSPEAMHTLAASEGAAFAMLSEAEEARYFKAVCAVHTSFDRSQRLFCADDLGAVTLQQIYELQQGLDLCAGGDHTRSIKSTLERKLLYGSTPS